jgi:hypothetical protein
MCVRGAAEHFHTNLWCFNMQAAILAALPWLIPILLQGIESVKGTPEKPLPSGGLSAADAQALWAKHEAAHPTDIDAARKAFASELESAHKVNLENLYHAHKGQSPMLGAKVKRGFGKAVGFGGSAMNLAFMAMMAKDMFGSRDGGAENLNQMMAAGSGGEQTNPEIAGLMSMLQQSGAQRPPTPSRGEMYRTQGMADTQKMGDVLGSKGGQTLGVREDLQQLIKGYEDQIDSVSHTEPISMAQALARQGIVRPRGPLDPKFDVGYDQILGNYRG